MHSINPHQSNAETTRRQPRAAATGGLQGDAQAGPLQQQAARNPGVMDYAAFLAGATPMQIVESEKRGVDGSLLKDVARCLSIPASRFFEIIGVPKATAEKKAAAGEFVGGSGGIATLGLLRLLGMAQEIVADSTADEARDFDVAQWFGSWLERPQPSLGGDRPADLIASPTGVEIVARLLGSLESGAYQ